MSDEYTDLLKTLESREPPKPVKTKKSSFVKHKYELQSQLPNDTFTPEDLNGVLGWTVSTLVSALLKFSTQGAMLFARTDTLDESLASYKEKIATYDAPMTDNGEAIIKSLIEGMKLGLTTVIDDETAEKPVVANVDLTVLNLVFAVLYLGREHLTPESLGDLMRQVMFSMLDGDTTGATKLFKQPFEEVVGALEGEPELANLLVQLKNGELPANKFFETANAQTGDNDES